MKGLQGEAGPRSDMRRIMNFNLQRRRRLFRRSKIPLLFSLNRAKEGLKLQRRVSYRKVEIKEEHLGNKAHLTHDKRDPLIGWIWRSSISSSTHLTRTNSEANLALIGILTKYTPWSCRKRNLQSQAQLLILQPLRLSRSILPTSQWSRVQAPRWNRSVASLLLRSHQDELAFYRTQHSMILISQALFRTTLFKRSYGAFRPRVWTAQRAVRWIRLIFHSRRMKRNNTKESHRVCVDILCFRVLVQPVGQWVRIRIVLFLTC